MMKKKFYTDEKNIIRRNDHISLNEDKKGVKICQIQHCEGWKTK